jgi:copper chaperone CopZ
MGCAGEATVTESDVREIVAALKAVPGVAHAEVEPDAHGPGVLRLGLVPGVDEVQVATSVGKLLRERFGLGVDAERVQLVEDADVPPEMPIHVDEERRPRPAIQRMHLISSGLDITATVTLTHEGRSCGGECVGTATQSGVQRAVAGATLRAVEGLLGNRVRFELEHVEVAPIGRDRTALVSITMLTSAGGEKLTGAAAVREDARQAVIRATLDAVNRRVERMLAEAS